MGHATPGVSFRSRWLSYRSGSLHYALRAPVEMTLLWGCGDDGGRASGLCCGCFGRSHGDGFEDLAALLDDIEVVGGKGGEFVDGA